MFCLRSHRGMGRKNLPRIEDHTLAGLRFEAWCGGCRRHRYWAPAEALRVFGGRTPIKAAEIKLRCQGCGATGRSNPGVVLRMSISDYYAKLGEVGGSGSRRRPSADDEVEL